MWRALITDLVQGMERKEYTALHALESKVLNASNKKNGGISVKQAFFVMGSQKPYFFLGWILYSSNFGGEPGMGKSVR